MAFLAESLLSKARPELPAGFLQRRSAANSVALASGYNGHGEYAFYRQPDPHKQRFVTAAEALVELGENPKVPYHAAPYDVPASASWVDLDR